MSSRPTFSESQEFHTNYQSLESFLAEFNDYEGRTNEQILRAWIESSSIDVCWKREIVAQGRLFLAQSRLPFSLIGDIGNRYFPNDEAAYAWLTDALNQIEATLRS